MITGEALCFGQAGKGVLVLGKDLFYCVLYEPPDLPDPQLG